MKRGRNNKGAPFTPGVGVRKSYRVNTGGDGGRYVGRLPPPRRRPPPSKYDKAGYSAEYERYGTQSLAEVSYVGCTSLCHSEVGSVVGIAFIRKLMKRHYQYEYTSPNQLLNPVTPGTDIGLGPRKIAFYYEEVTSADAEPTIASGYTFTVGSSETLATFASAFYTNVLSSGTFGSTQASTNYPIRRLHGYQLMNADYTQTGATTEFTERWTTVFPLRNQYLTVYSAVKFGIQNVTVADAATAGDAYSGARIDANPVKGKVMRFKDLLPRLQQRNGAGGAVTSDNSYKLQIDPNADGIIKPSAAITGDWRQIPTASMFSNCVGEAGIVLNPGQIKDTSIMFKFNGTLENFIRGFSAGISPLSKGGFGTCLLFALEKRMPTGTSADVSVNFHYESRVGAVFGRRLGALMQRGGGAGAAVTAA